MIPCLTGPIVVEQFCGFWVVRAPIDYLDDDFRFGVPVGVLIDFASIPVGMREIFPPTDSCYSAAAALHDWAYASHVVDRATADLILYRAARAAGTGRARSWCLWAGVRLGGGPAYRTGPARQAALRRQYETLTENVG